MSQRIAYLLLLASGIERRRFADCVAEISPQLTRHGGCHLALAPSTTVEPFGHHDAPTSAMLSRWASVERLREFWRSPECQAVINQRSRFGAFVAVALEGPAEERPDGSSDEVLAIFLGSGPSPALFEAEGARALTLVRERQVEALEGVWTHGDVAIYGWASAQSARRQLVSFSSGQRGRALLLPALGRSPSARLTDASACTDSVAA